MLKYFWCCYLHTFQDSEWLFPLFPLPTKYNLNLAEEPCSSCSLQIVLIVEEDHLVLSIVLGEGATLSQVGCIEECDQSSSQPLAMFFSKLMLGLEGSGRGNIVSPHHCHPPHPSPSPRQIESRPIQMDALLKSR